MQSLKGMGGLMDPDLFHLLHRVIEANEAERPIRSRNIRPQSTRGKLLRQLYAAGYVQRDHSSDRVRVTANGIAAHARALQTEGARVRGTK